MGQSGSLRTALLMRVPCCDPSSSACATATCAFWWLHSEIHISFQVAKQKLADGVHPAAPSIHGWLDLGNTARSQTAGSRRVSSIAEVLGEEDVYAAHMPVDIDMNYEPLSDFRLSNILKSETKGPALSAAQHIALCLCAFESFNSQLGLRLRHIA